MNTYRMLAVVSCGFVFLLEAGSAAALDLKRLTVGPATFEVELAVTTLERERGLMFRKELPKGQGMLFEQPTGSATFWMKNTLISLDLLYFDPNGKLLQIEANVPPCTTPHCPIYPSKTSTIRYVLEIKGGEAALQNIQLGDRLRLESQAAPSSSLTSPAGTE